MARQHDEPSQPRGMASERISKTASTDHEQTVGKSPARPLVRDWASPSYDATTGRANIWSEPDRDRQVPSAGRHTAPNNTKRGSRPGRW
jgi:hypothetical protein